MAEKFITAKEWLVVIIASGIIGTAVMTMFMYVLTFVTKRVMNVAKTLGTMITCQTEEDGRLSDSGFAMTIGVIVHYAIGILFAYCYHLLWMYGVGQPDFWNGLFLGFISGIFAVIFWFVFFAIHPFPPHIDLKNYLISLFLAHFVFASVTVAVYIFLTERM